MKNAVDIRRSEYGGAGVKFMFVLLVLVLAGNAGLNYVPVAYNGESFKQEMQAAVVNAFAVPRANPVENLKARLQKAASDYDLPADAVIDVKQAGNKLQAHASYTKTVGILPFGLYSYQYQFDHTATPTGFLLKEN